MSAQSDQSLPERPSRCKSIAQFESGAALAPRRPVQLRSHSCSGISCPGGHDRPHRRTRHHVWLRPRPAVV